MIIKSNDETKEFKIDLNTYIVQGKGQEVLDCIKENGKVNELEEYIQSDCSYTLIESELNDFLRFEKERIYSALNIDDPQQAQDDTVKDDLQVYYETKIMPLQKQCDESGYNSLSEEEKDMLAEYSDMHKDEYHFRPRMTDHSNDMCYQAYQAELEQAKAFISDYNASEHKDGKTDFSNLSNISIGETTTEDEQAIISISIDLIKNRMVYKLDNEIVKTDDYSCLKEFLDFDLQHLGGIDNSFDNHVGEVQCIYDERMAKEENMPSLE